MNTQLHLARSIVDGRALANREHVQLRTVELAREQARRDRRARLLHRFR